MDNNNNKKSPAQIVGSICGTVIFACVAICLMAVAIALTCKFVMWLF